MGDLSAQTRLDAAWRALLAELPSVSTRLDAGLLATDVVIDVLCDAARRVLENPEGHTDGSVSIDDYSESWKADPATRSNDLYFTRAELRRLAPALRGAFTITPGG